MSDPFEPTLEAYLKSADVAEADSKLAILMDHLQPIIGGTLRKKLQVSLRPDDLSRTNQDALELAGEVKLLLIAEFARLRSHLNGKTIRNPDAYAASVTLNAYRQYLRTRYPLRSRLRNKLRYLLSHHPHFALWETEGGWFCARRKDRTFAPRKISDQPALLEELKRSGARSDARMIECIRDIFEIFGGPVPLNDLVSTIAEIFEVRDHAQEFDDESPVVINLADPGKGTAIKLEQREQLARVWQEIGELPLRHRAALLLNLRDQHGDCLVTLLPLLGVASIRAIAESLGFKPSEFAEIWRELPWDDLKIAEFLGLTRQQVINLRQSARARLARLVPPE